jgi:hypothetical protein
MYPCFEVEGLSAERLLREWRWLAPGEFTLLAVNPFGDLFLKSAKGTVHRIDITAGTISVVADSEEEFRGAASDLSKKEEWFLADDLEKAERKGYSPSRGQCIGSKVPWVFRESATVADNLRVADLYEYVSFMGDVHRQMRDVADGGTVRIQIVP